MSQSNLEIVRTAYAAFNRRDYDAVGAICHPQAEWYPYLGVVEGAVYRGHEAIVRMWESLDEVFGGTLRVEARELIDCGDKVVVVAEATATGGESGAEVKQTWAQVMTVRDGLVLRVEPYADRDAALEAAGLSEPVTAREHVEVVRSLLDGFNRGDSDAVVATFAEECELHEPPEMPDRQAGGYRGHEGIREWMRNLRGTADISFELRDPSVVGDVVISEWIAHGRGQASGVPIEWSTFTVLQLRGGKIARAAAFLTRSEALESAGLRE